MELSLEAIIGLASLFLGGSGIVGIITWRWARKKAKAEASEAEAMAEKAKFESVQAAVEATQKVQDSYQQLLTDMKADREEQRAYAEEQKQYIAELKEDRRHLRAERDELRGRVEKVEKEQYELRMTQARQGRMIELLRPLACGRRNCLDRIPAEISDVAADEPANAQEPTAKSSHNDDTTLVPNTKQRADNVAPNPHDIDPYNEN